MHSQKPSLHFHDCKMKVNDLSMRYIHKNLSHSIRMILTNRFVYRMTTSILNVLSTIHITQTYYQLIALPIEKRQTRKDFAQHRVVISNIHQHEIVFTIFISVLVCHITILIILEIKT